jgi:hypothetical protein
VKKRFIFSSMVVLCSSGLLLAQNAPKTIRLAVALTPEELSTFQPALERIRARRTDLNIRRYWK